MFSYYFVLLVVRQVLRNPFVLAGIISQLKLKGLIKRSSHHIHRQEKNQKSRNNVGKEVGQWFKEEFGKPEK